MTEEANTVEHQKKSLQEDIYLYVIHHNHGDQNGEKEEMRWQMVRLFLCFSL